MKESILSRIKVCPICKSAYLEEIGEFCRCPSVIEDEEPRVKDYEDVQTQPAL